MSQQPFAHHHLENSTPLKHAPEGIYVAYPLGDPPLPRIEETDWCEPCTPEEARQHAYLFVAMLAHALSRLGHDVTDVVVDE